MAYITTERVAEIRKELKETYPNYKFSIRRERYSSIYIKILSGPIDLFITQESRESGFASVNHYWISDVYRDHHEIKEILNGIYEIVNRGNRLHGSVYDDYGQTPDFYVHISIGDYDKPYVVTSISRHSQNVINGMKQNVSVETPVIYSPKPNKKAFIYSGVRYTREELDSMGLGASASIAILTHR